MATKVKEPVAVATASSKNHKSLISDEKLKLLYATMLQCRLLVEKAVGLTKMGHLQGNFDSAVGQEAAAVGVAIDLRRQDAVAAANRDIMVHHIKGVPLKAMMRQLSGGGTSPENGRNPSQNSRSDAQDHGYAALNIIPRSSTRAAQLNVSTGIALANKRKKSDNIVVAFSGDGSTSLDDWQEALNFAGVHDLPMIFVSQNYHRRESLPLQPQTRVEDISTQAQDYRFPCIPVDGKDVVAMYRVAYEAMQRARNGGGPTLIEAKGDHWYGHSSMDAAKYLSPAELEQRKEKDPIAAMERYLSQRNLFTPQWKKEMTEAIEKELDEAMECAEENGRPSQLSVPTLQL